MPPLPASTKTLRIAVNGGIVFANFSNIIHFTYSGSGGSSADLNTLAATVAASWVSRVIPIVTNQYFISDVQIVDLTSNTSPVGSAASSHNGSLAGTPVGNNLCTLIKHTISRRYRGGHPRTYAPPGDSSKLTSGNTWTAAQVTAYQTAWNGLITDIETSPPATLSSLTYVNLSYFSGNAVRVTPVVDEITGSSVESMAATQRRRLGR